MFQCRPQGGNRCGVDIIHIQDRVRIAHGDQTKVHRTVSLNLHTPAQTRGPLLRRSLLGLERQAIGMEPG